MDANWKRAKEEMNKFFIEHPEYSNFEIGRYFKEAIGTDIKHVLFGLSRYKFVCKLMAYKKNLKVLEIGSNEAWGSIMLQQNTNLSEYVAVDFDEDAVNWNRKNLPAKFQFVSGNIFDIKEVKKNYFDLIFSLDVIEHVAKDKEDEFFQIIVDNLADSGVVVLGTPHINMIPYASIDSKVSHINLYDQKRLYNLADKYFKSVFIFNMNDEVVNTGFSPMSCYIFAICCNKR